MSFDCQCSVALPNGVGFGLLCVILFCFSGHTHLLFLNICIHGTSFPLDQLLYSDLYEFLQCYVGRATNNSLSIG